MKKTLLTLSAIIGVSTGAFAQGELTIANAAQPNFAGFNSVSSNPGDNTLSDFASGSVTLAIYTIAAGSTATTEAATINTDSSTKANEQAAVALMQSEFTQQAFGLTSGSEAMTQVFNITEGDINTTGTGDQANYVIGTSGTLASGASVLYGVIASMTIGGQLWDGALVMNASSSYGAGGGSFPTPNMDSVWPNQNLLLAPVPEPTTLALAGLGGLSLLALRRRKA